ncbi:RsmD family RNA methyltransferase [Propionibacteriaceae bacterium Y2011]
MSRIIGGSRGGRRLTMPSGSMTRPTSDRVREAVFASITSWCGTVADDPSESLAGQAFCDLYAGSGAVGLEAASRGASPVLLVEKDRRTAGIARRNAKDLDLTVTVESTKVEQLVARPARLPGRPARGGHDTAGSDGVGSDGVGSDGGEPTSVGFDLVWLDPPYDLASNSVDAVLADLVDNGWVVESGLVIVERSVRTAPPVWPAGFTGGWTKAYGETVVHFGCA